MRGGPIVAAALLASLPGSIPPARAAERAAGLHLGEVQLRVFYRGSGRLSEDLLHGDGPRATWNLAIGGGGLAEPADDALAILPVLAEPGKDGSAEVFSDVPIVLRVRGARGKVIGQRIVRGVLTSGDGHAHVALWLADVTCAGKIAIEGTLGTQRVTGTFDFRCGE